MLISYPVLPADALNDDEDVYLHNILNGYVLDDEGRYPVTTLATPTGLIHRWHGGIHLQGRGQPIRAIADGVVVAYRFAPACETYEGLGDYDTSFVLIRHETETGENTAVAFYSLYMHLANRQALQPDRFTQLPSWMKQAAPSTEVRRINQKIWRKDVLGFAGSLYNHEAWHFEIFTGDEDFGAFWRDSLFKSDGCGSDDYYGDSHFVIPSGRQFLARHPRTAQHGPHRIEFDSPAHYDLPEGQDGSNQGGSEDATLYVSVKLFKGTRIATTYTWDKANDRYAQIGSPVQQPDYEYELYRLATALYPDCPSAGYEWLRFGRVLGPDRTTRNENWQLVRYAGDKIGYIDLAPNEIVKLSDADFPHWHGWEKREQGQLVNPDDGLCKDDSVLTLTQAADADSKKKLRHLICKHPSEWDASDLAGRYADLRKPDQPLQEDESWFPFEAHVRKLAFWSEAGLPQRDVWHFHPLQFIRHFRKCGWLATEELASIMPRYPYYEKVGAFHRAHTTGPALVYQVSHDTARSRTRSYGTSLNRTMQKYCTLTYLRTAHFLAQTVLETDRWKTMREYGRGAANAAIPMAQYYSAFYGRGIMQLTWAGNYKDYKNYRSDGLPDHAGSYTDSRITENSVHWTSAPGAGASQIRWAPRFDPDLLATSALVACDSGGFYWVSKSIGGGERNINAVCDRGSGTEVAGRVSILVNGGGNGYMERQAYFQYLLRYLSDDTTQAIEAEYVTPRGRITVHFGKPQ